MPRDSQKASFRRAGRVPALDGLRGVLATVVLADHAALDLHCETLGHAANLSVVVFFVVCGMVLTRQWDGQYGRFLLARFARLWPVFVVCMASGCLLAWRQPLPCAFIWVPYPYYDGNLVCPPVWSLYLEVWAALFMPVIVWTSRGGALRTLLCVAALITLTVVWVPRDTALRAFESYLVFFVAGAAFSRTCPRSQLLETRLPQYLGRISYSLYLCHWLVLRACVLAFGPPGVFVGAVLAFVIADIMYRLVERPSIALSRWLKTPLLPQDAVLAGG